MLQPASIPTSATCGTLGTRRGSPAAPRAAPPRRSRPARCRSRSPPILAVDSDFGGALRRHRPQADAGADPEDGRGAALLLAGHGRHPRPLGEGRWARVRACCGPRPGGRCLDPGSRAHVRGARCVVQRTRLGFDPDAFDRTTPEIAGATVAIEALRGSGAEPVEVDLSMLEAFDTVATVLTWAEASAVERTLGRDPGRYAPAIRARLELALSAHGADHERDAPPGPRPYATARRSARRGGRARGPDGCRTGRDDRLASARRCPVCPSGISD